MVKCYLDFVSVSRGYFGAFEGFRYRCSAGHPIQGDSISCGLFCLLYACSIVHGVAMNFSQVDMPVFRKRMAFDILSGKATEPLGREWRGLKIIIQPRSEKVWKNNSHCSIKCVARCRTPVKYEWFRETSDGDVKQVGDVPLLKIDTSNEVDGTYYCRMSCSGGTKVQTSGSCIFSISDEKQGPIAMTGNLIEIVTDWNCNRQTLTDVMDNLTDISNYIEEIIKQSPKKEKPDKQYQRHHAYLVWPTHEFRRLEDCSVMGTDFFTTSTVTDIAHTTTEVFRRKGLNSVDCVQKVIIPEVITKLIMDRENCSYERATALAYGRDGEEKTSFFDEWDEVVGRAQAKSKRKGIPKKLKNKHA